MKIKEIKEGIADMQKKLFRECMIQIIISIQKHICKEIQGDYSTLEDINNAFLSKCLTSIQRDLYLMYTSEIGDSNDIDDFISLLIPYKNFKNPTFCCSKKHMDKLVSLYAKKPLTIKLVNYAKKYCSYIFLKRSKLY